MKYFFYPILFIALSSCELFFSPGPELPPITTEGKNTFGCLINGEVWLPKNSIVQSGNGLTAEFIADDKSLFGISSTRNGDQYLKIAIFDCCDKTSYFLINELATNSYASFTDYNSNCLYETDSIKTGNFGSVEIIHFEPRKFIIAGTFEFTVVTDDCDTLRITEGRFDVNYNAI